MKVSLDELIGYIEMQVDESRSFINRKTGEIVSVSSEALRNAEEMDDDEILELLDWQQEEMRIAIDIEENFMDYEGIPKQFEVNEYRMMERFCYSVKNERKMNALLEAINGRGAFRRFKDKVTSLGLDDQWYQFRDECYKQFAMDWCDARGIDYE